MPALATVVAASLCNSNFTCRRRVSLCLREHTVRRTTASTTSISATSATVTEPAFVSRVIVYGIVQLSQLSAKIAASFRQSDCQTGKSLCSTIHLIVQLAYLRLNTFNTSVQIRQSCCKCHLF